MAVRTDVEDASEGLLFLNKERPIRLMPQPVLDHLGLQRIGPRLQVLHLHPHWTELVDLTGLAQCLLLDGSLPILATRRHCDPALRLRNYLHHFLRLAIRILVNNILVDGGVVSIVEGRACSAILGPVGLKHTVEVE